MTWSNGRCWTRRCGTRRAAGQEVASVPAEGAPWGSSALMRGGRFSPQACARWPLGRGDKAERLVLLIPRSEYRPECGNCPQTLPHAYSVRFCSGRLPSSPLPRQGRESQTPPHPAGHPDPARRCPCLTVTQGMWARGRRGSALRFSLGQTRKVWVRIQNPVPMLGVGRLSPAPLRRWGSRSPPTPAMPGAEASP